MAGLAKLRLVMEIDGDKAVVVGLDKVDAAVDRAGRTTRTATEQMASGMGQVETATGKMAKGFSDFQSQISGLIGGFSLGVIIQQSLQAALMVERINASMKATAGSGEAAARELAFIREEAERLGLVYTDTALAYAKFSASTKNTPIEGDATRKIFSGVSEAVTALKLSGDEANGIFLALSQMMSKGKISAEELSGQLGERLPGAVKLTADAMGLTTQELLKQMQEGKLMSSDVLPKLAEQLHKTYGAAAVEAAQGGQAEINRFNNALFDTKAALGTALMPTFTSLLKNVISPFVSMLKEGVAQLEKLALTAIYTGDQVATGLKGIFSGEAFSKQGYEALRQRGEGNYQNLLSGLADIDNKYAPGSSQKSATDLAAEQAKIAEARRKELAAAAKAEADKNRASELAAEEKHAHDLRKAAEDYHRYKNLLTEESLKTSENARNLELANLELSYAQHLISESAFLQAKNALNEKAAKEQADILEYKMLAAIEATRAAESKLSAGKDGSLTGTTDQVSTYHKAIQDEAKTRIDLDKAYNHQAITGLKGQLDTQKQITTEANNRLAFEKELAAMKAANSATAASMVGTNAAGGFDSITDQVANQMAVQEQAHQQRMNAITAESQALMAQADKIDNLAARAAAYNDIASADAKARALAEQKNGQVTTRITQDGYKAQLSSASQYTGMASDLFSALASTQDESSRKGFESAKAYNLAATIMNTATAIMAQLSIAGPVGWAGAALAAATGVIQIAKISSTSFGGGGSAAAPPGSVSASGGGSTGSGLGNLPQNINSVQDSRTNESIDALIGSTDNAALVIGKLSKSVDALTKLFETGGAGNGLATNAPLKSMDVGSAGGFMSSIGKDMKTAWTVIKADLASGGGLAFSDILTGGALSSSAAITSVLGATLGIGNKWANTGAGMELGVNAGQVTARDYVDSKKKGGLFGKDKYNTEYDDNAAASEYINNLMQPFISDMTNMARTLGTTFDPSQYSAEATKIATAGRSTEDIGKDLSAWMLKTMQEMSLTVQGLDAAVGDYDDVYTTLKTLNDALVTTNDAFTLVGKTALDGSISNAKWAVSLQNLMGGQEAFTEKMGEYFSAMYTDEEQARMKAEAARIKVANTFAELSQAVPESIAGFNSLRDSINVTTIEGAQLFAAITEIAPAFAEMTKYAEEFAKAQQDLNQSSLARILTAQGKTNEAAIYDQQISQAAELKSAKESLLDTGLLEIAQTLEREALLKQQSDATASALASEAAKTLNLNLAFETLAGNTAEVTRLTNLQREASIAGWSENDIAIQRNTWALQDQKKATDAAAASSKTYTNNLADAHSRLVNAAMANVTDAQKTLQNSVNAEKKNAQTIYDFERKLADELVTSLTESTGKLKSLSESLKSATDAINPMKWGEAQEQINGALAAARGGVFADSASLQAAISVLGNRDTSGYATATDYARAQQIAANSMNELKKLTDGQLTTEEQSLKAAQDQVKSLDDGFAAQTKYLDGILSAAQMQIDALNNINNTITSVTAAQSVLAPAISGAQAAISAQKAAVFNADSYLAKNPDVAAALAGPNTMWGPGTGMTALDHWNLYGKAEGRSFAVGTNYVPYDMTANIHEGERIIPKADNYKLMQRLDNPSSNSELVAELRELKAEMKQLREEQKAGLIAIAKNTGETARQMRRWEGGGMPEVRVAA